MLSLLLTINFRGQPRVEVSGRLFSRSGDVELPIYNL